MAAELLAAMRVRPSKRSHSGPPPSGRGRGTTNGQLLQSDRKVPSTVALTLLPAISTSPAGVWALVKSFRKIVRESLATSAAPPFPTDLAAQWRGNVSLGNPF